MDVGTAGQKKGYFLIHQENLLLVTWYDKLKHLFCFVFIYAYFYNTFII
jgi:hypothetical protein